MFANGSGALSNMGGSMMRAGKNLQQPRQAGGAPNMSVRKQRKMLKNQVDAISQLEAVSTAEHAKRNADMASHVTNFAEMGHHNINFTTGHGSVTVQSTPRGYTSPASGESSRQAPTQGGYYSGHSAHTEIAASAGNAPRNTTTVGPALGAGSGRPILALPAGSSTVYDAQAGKRPGTTAPEAPKQPFVANASGEVKKPGAKDLNIKTPSTEERTFIGTKTGRFNREQGKNTAKKIENPKLNTPYEKTPTSKAPVDRTDAQAVDRRLTAMEDDYLNKKKATKKTKKAD